MSLEITAKVLYSLQEQTGQGKNGPWVKQDIIVETEEQYPKKVCMSAWGDMVTTFRSFAPGTRLKINFRVESREYNGRWYTDIKAWKVEKGMQAGDQRPTSSQEPVFTGPPPGPADDLPF